MDYSHLKVNSLNDSFNSKNEMNDSQLSPLLLKTDVNKINFSSLINQQAIKSWLPLPHPCIFPPWSSTIHSNLFKQHPFFCLNSNSTPSLNVTDSELKIRHFGSVTKEEKSSNSHCINNSENNEVVSNNSEYTAKDVDMPITEKEAEGQNTLLLVNNNNNNNNNNDKKEENNFLPKKFTTRETTNFLKSWLNEHRYNPYPTKNEKVMLALITKMSLTQISTWFANARRRLKKENQMTWAPKIRHHRMSIHSMSSNNMNTNYHNNKNNNNNNNSGRINRRYDGHSSPKSNNNNNNNLSKFKSTTQTDVLTNQINSSNIYQSHEDNTTLLRRRLLLDQLLLNNKQQSYSELNDNLKRTSDILSNNSNFADIIHVLHRVPVKEAPDNDEVNNPADEADNEETRVVSDNDDKIFLDDKSNDQDVIKIDVKRLIDDDIPCSTSSSLSSSPTSAKNASDRNLQLNISKIWSVADVID